jgi:hypothetical protein
LHFYSVPTQLSPDPIQEAGIWVIA